MQETKAVTVAAPLSPTIWTQEQVDLIKRTIAVGATNDELALFAYICQRTGLDPFVRQIYAIKRSGKITFQTGIDGYRVIADATNHYAGSDDPIYVMNSDGKIPISATVTVHKFVQGQRCAFTATARWDEYYPQDSRDQWMWKRMPCGQLGKCAESLALRKAFPMKLSGLYIDEEMQQADTQHEAGAARLPPVGSVPPPAPMTIEGTNVRERAPEPDNPERTAVLREIDALYKEAIAPLRQPTLYKAIYYHSFQVESPGYIKAQPLEILSAGMKLYRHLTAQLTTWDREVSPSVEDWIAQQKRTLALELAADDTLPDGIDPVTGEIDPAMPDDWLTARELQERQEQHAQREREEAALLDRAQS